MIEQYLRDTWKWQKYTEDPDIVRRQWLAHKRTATTYNPNLREMSRWVRFNGWLKDQGQLQVRLPTWRAASKE